MAIELRSSWHWLFLTFRFTHLPISSFIVMIVLLLCLILFFTILQLLALKHLMPNCCIQSYVSPSITLLISTEQILSSVTVASGTPVPLQQSKYSQFLYHVWICSNICYICSLTFFVLLASRSAVSIVCTGHCTFSWRHSWEFSFPCFYLLHARYVCISDVLVWPLQLFGHVP